MRLICPNCGAQYEVDAQVIPEAGRDVQCSNCGKTWFQLHPDAERDLEAEELAAAEPEDPPEEDEPEQEVRPTPRTPRRELDPRVTGVLREEAAREAEVRRAEKSGLETQPDLGLDTPRRKAPAPPPPDADEDGEEPAPQRAHPPASGSRRDLLPDIDKVSTDLPGSRERARAEPEEPETFDEGAEETGPVRRRGFRLGFGLTLLVVALAVAAYALSPRIVAAVPEAEPYLAAYVDWVNGLRAQLNDTVDTTVARITEFIAGLTEES